MAASDWAMGFVKSGKRHSITSCTQSYVLALAAHISYETYLTLPLIIRLPIFIKQTFAAVRLFNHYNTTSHNFNKVTEQLIVNELLHSGYPYI